METIMLLDYTDVKARALSTYGDKLKGVQDLSCGYYKVSLTDGKEFIVNSYADGEGLPRSAAYGTFTAKQVAAPKEKESSTAALVFFLLMLFMAVAYYGF